MTVDALTLLRSVLAHAEGERDAALLRLRQADAAAHASLAQESQLQAYRGDFRARWQQRLAQTCAMPVLHCHHGLTQRLDQAIEQQGDHRSQTGARADQARAALVQREQRVAALRKLIERRQAELLRLQVRQQQKTDDESGQRLRRIDLHTATN